MESSTSDDSDEERFKEWEELNLSSEDEDERQKDLTLMDEERAREREVWLQLYPQDEDKRQKGPFRKEQAFSSCLADLSLLSYCSQRSKIFACRSLYLRRWILRSFFSDTKRIWIAVSWASWCSSLIRT